MAAAVTQGTQKPSPERNLTRVAQVGGPTPMCSCVAQVGGPTPMCSCIAQVGGPTPMCSCIAQVGGSRPSPSVIPAQAGTQAASSRNRKGADLLSRPEPFGVRGGAYFPEGGGLSPAAGSHGRCYRWLQIKSHRSGRRPAALSRSDVAAARSTSGGPSSPSFRRGTSPRPTAHQASTARAAPKSQGAPRQRPESRPSPFVIPAGGNLGYISTNSPGSPPSRG